jgi:hypothetical protein
MSVQALGAVLDHSESTGNARLVAISLANHFDKNGVGWLSVRLAAQEARIKSRTTVRQHVKSLREELGELVELVPADGETHRPPLYWLNLPGLSGECGDDHSYFQTYGPRAELVGPGSEVDPGPGPEVDPHPGQELDPPGVKICPHPGSDSAPALYRKPSKSQKTDNPDDKSSGPLCALLADLIAGNDPNEKRPTVTAAWLNAERLLLERDERDFDATERLIRWCQNDDFWKANILSMPKFRQKYGQLWLQASRQEIEQQKAARRSGEHPADQRIRQLREGPQVIEGQAEEER